MVRIRTFLIIVLIIVFLLGLLLKCKNEISNKSENKRFNGDIILSDRESSLSKRFQDIINIDDLVLGIPEYSCQDCIEKVLKTY